jgi:hypothetical protein
MLEGLFKLVAFRSVRRHNSNSYDKIKYLKNDLIVAMSMVFRCSAAAVGSNTPPQDVNATEPGDSVEKHINPNLPRMIEHLVFLSELSLAP